MAVILLSAYHTMINIAWADNKTYRWMASCSSKLCDNVLFGGLSKVVAFIPNGRVY